MCFMLFPGSPRVAPRGCRTITARGGRLGARWSALVPRQTVLMPTVSRVRATSPPDWWQTGQTTTSTAASTLAIFSRQAICRAESASSL